jgi:hypothetical protein
MWNAVGETISQVPAQVRRAVFRVRRRFGSEPPASLVQGWFDSIIAPQKELIWFENSGQTRCDSPRGSRAIDRPLDGDCKKGEKRMNETAVQAIPRTRFSEKIGFFTFRPQATSSII